MKRFRKRNAQMLIMVMLLWLVTGCSGSRTATEETTTAASTEDTTIVDSTEEVFVTEKLEGDHDSDVEILQKIIEEQNALGAKPPTDLNVDAFYTWDENGRLIWLRWRGVGLKGEISFAGLTALIGLECDNNELSSLDVSNNKELTELNCGCNELNSLDVSNNTKLTYLGCFNNELSSLDVSNNTELTELCCESNQLSSLDVTNCTKLISLFYDEGRVTVTGYSN